MAEDRRAKANMYNQNWQNKTAGAYYTPGTAAPKIYPGEEERPSRPERVRKPVIRSDREIRPGTMLFIVLAFAAIVVVSIYMVSVRSSIISTQNTYEANEEALQKLRAENDSKEIYLNKSIDLEEVYKIATEELGMVYPSHDQIIYYERSDGGYVRQYEDIPNN